MTITVARTPAEVASLRETWRTLGPPDVNADPDVVLAVVEARADVERPHVVLAENGRRGMLVARVERTRLPVRVGYREVYAPKVRAVTVAQGGVFGGADDETLGALIDEAKRPLEEGGADVLRLRRVRIGSDLHRVARERPSRLMRARGADRSRRWRLALPGSLDEILASQSSNTRSNHRRYARKLEAEYGEQLVFDVRRDLADLERTLRDCEAVAEKTYQRGLGAGLASDVAERRLLELAAERGWLRAYVLSIAGEAKAFWIGQVYGGVFFTGPTGYDPALASRRVGTYVLMKMLEDLCEDDSVREVDYGIGDAEYKRHFGSESWLEEDVLVFAPTLRGVRTKAVRSLALGVSDAARRVATTVPALGGLKRRWRSRLSSPGGGSS